MKTPSMRRWICSLTPLCAGLGQTPWLVLLLLPCRILPLSLGNDAAVQREASGSGWSCDLCRSSWTRSLLASPGVGAGFCTCVSGWAMLEWHYPAPSSPWRCARSGADGDMQKREINKLELEYDQPRIWRSFMWMFLPLEGRMGHLHHCIITSSYQASLPGEIKSSMPCSRDTMNSTCRENKPPVPRREDKIKIHRKTHKGIFSKGNEGRSVHCGNLPLKGFRGKGFAALEWPLALTCAVSTHRSPVTQVVQSDLSLLP